MTRSAVRSAHALATRRLLSLQCENGSWEGELVMNNTPLSQYVIVRQLVGRPVPEASRAAMIRHYRATVTPEGGWRIIPDREAGPSSHCTVLAHVALRLLGLPADDPLPARAAAWVRAQPGGAAAVPAWGRIWLAACGLYDYRAINPLPPEAFVMPRLSPFHPDRLYNNARVVYQAMAWLYGTRYHGDLGPVTAELRRDLFADRPPRPADRTLLGIDTLRPPSPVLRLGHTALSWYERRPAGALRERALGACLARVQHEQRVTGQAALSSIANLLNVLVLHASGAAPDTVDRALKGLEYWRWHDEEEGTRFVGNRSATWDTAFAVEALLAHPTEAADAPSAPITSGSQGTPGTPDIRKALRRACHFLLDAQETEEIANPALSARSPVVGGWSFSDGSAHWPVSDCTAEAVVALLHAGHPPSEHLLGRTAAFLLDRQNRDGGFGAWEARRGSRFLELLNPSELFTQCMVEHSYVECTGSALLALAPLTARAPATERARLHAALRRGVRFLLRRQHGDGSWSAAWGVNRLYGTFFAVRGLLATGCPHNHPRLRRTAAWLQSVQLPDGGWGEHYQGFLEQRYVPHAESQPVMTAWALLTLMEITGPDHPAVLDGIRLLTERQRPDGTWRQTTAVGAFNGSGILGYRLYPQYFPHWALGRWLALTAARPLT
ncbi:hypothetical protein ACWD4G_16405 [Streptomyces sp. NPDC002643]